MNVRQILQWLATGMLVVASTGCCCMNTCWDNCTDMSCNQLCGQSCGSTCVGHFETRQLCGDDCGGCGSCTTGDSCGCSGGGCGSCTSMGGGMGMGMGPYSLGSGCAGWNVPQFFVGPNGRPCLGPIYGLANAFRGALMNCGCGGELYIDEWVSDPPRCNDPCDCQFSGGDCGGGVGGCGGVCGCAASTIKGEMDYQFARRKQNWAGRSRSACQNGSCQGQNAQYAPNGYPHASHSKSQHPGRSEASRVASTSSRGSRQVTQKKKTSSKSRVRQAGWFN